MSRISRPSPAMVVAITALVFGASGTTYAAVKLPAKSVGAPQLKNKAVTTPKLKNAAVTRAKLQPDSVNGAKIAPQSIEADHVKQEALTGVQIDEGTLAPVPVAQSAGIGGLSYPSAGAQLPSGMGATAHIDCPSTLNPISGGVKVSDVANMFVIDTFPQGRGWTVNVANMGSGEGSYTYYVICAQPGTGAGTLPKPAKPDAPKRYRVAR
jgi:hypothetical protein